MTSPANENLMLEATHLQGNRWAVRPKGQLGIWGSYPVLWAVIYVNAHSAEEAIKKARGQSCLG